MRILGESSFKDLDVEEFRSALWQEAKSLDPWVIPTRSFETLLDDSGARSLAIFFSKAEWGEASDVHVQVSYFLQQLGRPHTKILGPTIVGTELRFHPFSTGRIKNGPLGTLVLDSPEPAEIPDLLLIPAVAIDSRGNRIGRGGGFYDRYISQHPKTKVCALVHSEYFFDEMPDEFFHSGDQKVNYVLTERELIKITKIRSEVLQ